MLYRTTSCMGKLFIYLIVQNIKNSKVVICSNISKRAITISIILSLLCKSFCVFLLFLGWNGNVRDNQWLITSIDNIKLSLQCNICTYLQHIHLVKLEKICKNISEIKGGDSCCISKPLVIHRKTFLLHPLFLIIILCYIFGVFYGNFLSHSILIKCLLCPMATEVEREFFFILLYFKCKGSFRSQITWAHHVWVFWWQHTVVWWPHVPATL